MTDTASVLDLTRHWAGYASLIVFVAAYLLVMLESKIHLRKSKPVILGAGIIWTFIGIAYVTAGDTTAGERLHASVGEFAELFLFVLVAMTFGQRPGGAQAVRGTARVAGAPAAVAARHLLADRHHGPSRVVAVRQPDTGLVMGRWC